MENFEEIADLLYKYIREDISTEESVRLQNWVQQSGKNQQFFDKASNTKLLLENVSIKRESLQQVDLDQAWQELKNLGWELPEEPEVKVIPFNWRKYAVAASLLIVVLAGAYLWLKPVNKQPAEIATTPKEIKNDVLPNTKNAVLTLADGTTIILDSAQNGMLATQGGMSVVKKDKGQLVYEGSPLATEGSPLAYNTITVPKGSDVVFITLSDGSKVWMNAASSIRYPTTFTGNVRKVEITGEAYFEVAKSVVASGTKQPGAKQSFIVQKGNMQVEVLGTHFNVNTYEEESNIKVTLIEGLVRVLLRSARNDSQKSEVVIKPGQQAVVKVSPTGVRHPEQSEGSEGAIRVKQDPNIEEVMAWKNGKFVFDNTGLETIMRQIERWYDIEVSYEGNIKGQEITLTGEISRYSNASQVLELLETTRFLQFTVEGRKITVKSAGVH